MKKLPSCITTNIDLTDEFEVSLIKHVLSKGNRSRYIKRLIYNDMMGTMQPVSNMTYQEPEENSEMSGFF